MPSLLTLVHAATAGVLLFVVGNGLLAVSETHVPSGMAALLVATTPIWMLVLDALRMRRMISTVSTAGLAVGTVGVAMLLDLQAGHVNGLYSVLLLVCAFAWAFGTIFARETTHHPLTTSLAMTVGGMVAIGVAFCLGETRHFTFFQISAQSWYGMLWLITGGAMIGYTAYAFVVRTLPAPTVSTYAYANPVVAVILGVLLLHEQITWNVIVGGVAIVISVILILVGDRRLEADIKGDQAPSEAA